MQTQTSMYTHFEKIIKKQYIKYGQTQWNTGKWIENLVN